MPIDETGRLWVQGPFQSRTISRMSRATYARARNLSRSDPLPYPSARFLMTRVAAEGNMWYQDTGPELHLSDFVFLTRMQTARRISERTTRIPSRDLVLERLLAEGTFDRRDTTPLHAGEAFAMNHASAMTQRLLMRIEVIEADVRPVLDIECSSSTNDLPSFVELIPRLRNTRRRLHVFVMVGVDVVKFPLMSPPTLSLPRTVTHRRCLSLGPLLAQWSNQTRSTPMTPGIDTGLIRLRSATIC